MKYCTLILLLLPFCSMGQYKLSIKNTDTSEIQVVMHGKVELNAVVPAHETKEFEVSNLTNTAGYVVTSTRGTFGSKSSGRTLDPGSYILVFMWSKKEDAWRTILRPKTEDNDPPPDKNEMSSMPNISSEDIESYILRYGNKKDHIPH